MWISDKPVPRRSSEDKHTGFNMQAIKRTVAASVILALAATLAGCLHGHHAQQVVHKPMKLGVVGTAIEQTVRNS